MTTIVDLFSVIRDARIQGVDDRALRAEALGWYEVLVEPSRQGLLKSRGTTSQTLSALVYSEFIRTMIADYESRPVMNPTHFGVGSTPAAPLAFAAIAALDAAEWDDADD